MRSLCPRLYIAVAVASFLDYLFLWLGQTGNCFVYMFTAFRNNIVANKLHVRVLWLHLQKICAMSQKRKVTAAVKLNSSVAGLDKFWLHQAVIYVLVYSRPDWY